MSTVNINTRRHSWRFIDLTGQTFHSWTVLGYEGTNTHGGSQWLCKCKCGTVKHVRASRLLQGTSQSCGCDRHRNKHHLSQSPEYRAFHKAKQRCTNPETVRFNDWGGRGIEFRFSSFEEFLNHLGNKPTPRHSLDRIDNDGHYEIGNVRWASASEQSRNRNDRRMLSAFGTSKLICDWASPTISIKLIYNRYYHYRWCGECSVSLEKGNVCRHKPLKSS